MLLTISEIYLFLHQTHVNYTRNRTLLYNSLKYLVYGN